MKLQFVASIAAVITSASSSSSLLNNTVLDSFDGSQWLKDNIPLIDIPDKTIEEIYYYRWSVLQRHLHYTYPGTGYVITEFQNPIGYASLFNTIIAAAGHQLQECRWLRNREYSYDYTKFWARGGGVALQYTNWVHHAALETAKAHGDIEFLTEMLDDLINLYNVWWEVYDHDVGLFYYLTSNDAQELSLPGYVYGKDENTFDGPMTYRPSHNSYMVSNARAIAEIAKHASNNDSIQSNFTKLADSIENAMYKYLWDPKQEFFVDVIKPDNPNLDPVPGREQVGVYPFRFGIGLEEKYTQPSIDQLFDGDGLWSPFGTTTLEQRNEFYSEYKFGEADLCIWNGQVWPFSETHTLHSLASIYRSNTSDLTADQYYEKLHQYAKSQYHKGQPFAGESHYPNLNLWSVNVVNRSENYMHSQYTDLVLTGLLGIVPSLEDELEISPIVPDSWDYFAVNKLPYHGHELTILYDKNGDRYGKGKGLTVLSSSDGKIVHSSDSKATKFKIKNKEYKQGGSKVNIACNPLPSGYPYVNTTDDNGWESQINDGYLWYDSVPENRWINNASHDTDTVQLNFARSRKFSSVSIAFYRDVDRPGRVDCPTSLEIYTSKGQVYSNKDYKCKPNEIDTIDFDHEADSPYLSVKFTNKKNKQVGIGELQVWVDRSKGPNYHAVDGSFTGDLVKSTNDDFGNTAVKLKNETDYVEIGGILAANSTKLVYSSPIDQIVEIAVNQYTAKNLTLSGDGKYNEYEIPMKLGKGLNYVKINGGKDELYIAGVKVE